MGHAVVSALDGLRASGARVPTVVSRNALTAVACRVKPSTAPPVSIKESRQPAAKRVRALRLLLPPIWVAQTLPLGVGALVWWATVSSRAATPLTVSRKANRISLVVT